MRNHKDFARVAQKAQDAFWAIVADEFPEVTTGDLDPLTSVQFDNACHYVVEAWWRGNQLEDLE